MRGASCLVVLLTPLLIVAGSDWACARQFFVGCTDDVEYQSIPVAVLAASPSDTVVVLPCVYRAEVLRDTCPTGWPILLGTDTPVIIARDADGPVVIEGRGEVDTYFVEAETREAVELPGFTLRHVWARPVIDRRLDLSLTRTLGDVVPAPGQWDDPVGVSLTLTWSRHWDYEQFFGVSYSRSSFGSYRPAVPGTAVHGEPTSLIGLLLGGRVYGPAWVERRRGANFFLSYGASAHAIRIGRVSDSSTSVRSMRPREGDVPDTGRWTGEMTFWGGVGVATIVGQLCFRVEVDLLKSSNRGDLYGRLGISCGPSFLLH